MKKSDIEKMLTKAGDNFVPNVIDKIMERVPQKSKAKITQSERDDSREKVGSGKIREESRNGGIRKHKMMTRAILAACVLILCIFASGHFYFSAEDSFVYLDINPSVMLTLNNAGNVKSLSNKNADAEKLLANESLNGLSLEDAIERILQLAVEQKYIDGDSDDNVISISILNKDLAKADKQMDKINKRANEYFENNGIKCKVDKVTGNKVENGKDKDKDKDKENGKDPEKDISPGKLKIMNEITAIDPSFSLEILESYSVKDLHKLLKKLEK